MDEKNHQPIGDQRDTPGEPEQDLDAPPRAFMPTVPFGDAKPAPSALIDTPETPEGEEER